MPNFVDNAEEFRRGADVLLDVTPHVKGRRINYFLDLDRFELYHAP